MNALDNACSPEQFDGAFCFGNSFGYADYKTTTDFLRTVNRCLKNGAGFVVDTGETVILESGRRAIVWRAVEN